MLNLPNNQSQTCLRKKGNEQYADIEQIIYLTCFNAAFLEPFLLLYNPLHHGNNLEKEVINKNRLKISFSKEVSHLRQSLKLHPLGPAPTDETARQRIGIPYASAY